MEVILWVLLTVATVFADESQERRSKLPYIADALGNTLPPPSNLPATVGSPVNLLTPDRYEFYTFDESGELVKRLMTLEEIQAIVAAGEETEGLVTFANDNQPTIAFNFSQPPYTKVHSVVTNVQNVLKAQMEAHKNKPHTQPTLDTPDVSDSWSLILPSIFGNTGVDITPDKTMGSYITPETDTIDINQPEEDENALSKEAQILVDTVVRDDNKFDTSSTTTSTITTSRPITTTKRIIKPPSSTIKITTTKTTIQPKTTTSTTTTSRPITKPNLLSSSNVTHKGHPTYTSTTMSSTSKPSSTSRTPVSATIKPITSTKVSENMDITNDRIHSSTSTSTTHLAPTTERGDIQYEMVSTYIPVSTVTYLSERITNKPKETTKIIPTLENNDKNFTTSYINSPTAWMINSQTDMTTNKIKETTDNDVYSSHDQGYEKINSTTITTQSVSPSITATSTEFTSLENSKDNEIGANANITNNIKENDPALPLFDVAQSLSQIASDLGGTYRPMETSNNFLESTKITNIDLESKENVEIEIPHETENNNDIKIGTNNKTDHFIKISTLEPHGNNEKTMSDIEENKINAPNNTQLVTNVVTTLDPVLSESMGDLLSQVVNEKPDSDQNIKELFGKEIETTTTEITTEATTEYNTAFTEATTEVIFIEKNIHTSNDINSGMNLMKMENKHKENNFTIGENTNSTIIKNSIKPLDISDKINDKNEGIVKINGTVSPDKQNMSLNSSTEKNEDIKIENEKSEESTPATTTKIDGQQISTLKNDDNTANSSLPSYKSDIETNINNDSEKSDYFQNQTDSLEKKDSYNKNQKQEGQELSPKVEEFKKKIQKVNIDDKELGNDRNNSWKLIPTVSPPKTHESTKFTKNKSKPDIYNSHENVDDKNIVLDVYNENQGLELTTKDLGDDIAEFTELCNELAFRYWNDMIETIDKKRSFVFSPYAITSMLAMMFMGAKGATSGEMNDILKLDDMVTFNPHFTLKNISDSIETTPAAGVVVSAFIRELYSDRSKGKILTFYKERAQHFYNGHVEEVNFKLISDIIRRRTNLLVKRYTWGKIMEYMKTNTIVMQPPLAAFSANIFQTDCSVTSVDGRDGEMYFVVSPNVRQRRLVPVPAVVYKNNFLAGYDPVLDATAAALGNVNSVVSTLFVMPGQQGNIVHAEDLEDLEKRLLNSNPSTLAWNRLLRTLLPRVGLELQIPRFSHKSVFNISSTLKRMGLKDLFDADHADLGGLNGPSKDLYLSDMIQHSSFTTCGEGMIGEQHHIEEYPEILEIVEIHKRRSARWITGWDEPRDYQRAFHDPHDVGEAMHLPLHLRPRQARLPSRNAQPARLKFDRPFLFFVRHNPSGMILYVGKYNPRLLP